MECGPTRREIVMEPRAAAAITVKEDLFTIASAQLLPAEAMQLGLLNGQSKTRFAPSADLTRAEAAQAVFNLLQKI